MRRGQGRTVGVGSGVGEGWGWGGDVVGVEWLKGSGPPLHDVRDHELVLCRHRSALSNRGIGAAHWRLPASREQSSQHGTRRRR